MGEKTVGREEIRTLGGGERIQSTSDWTDVRKEGKAPGPLSVRERSGEWEKPRFRSEPRRIDSIYMVHHSHKQERWRVHENFNHARLDA